MKSRLFLQLFPTLPRVLPETLGDNAPASAQHIRGLTGRVIIKNCWFLEGTSGTHQYTGTIATVTSGIWEFRPLVTYSILFGGISTDTCDRLRAKWNLFYWDTISYYFLKINIALDHHKSTHTLFGIVTDERGRGQDIELWVWRAHSNGKTKCDRKSERKKDR